MLSVFRQHVEHIMTVYNQGICRGAAVGKLHQECIALPVSVLPQTISLSALFAYCLYPEENLR
jgi:hypothetical protein